MKISFPQSCTARHASARLSGLSCVTRFRIATERYSPILSAAPFFRFFGEEGMQNNQPLVRAAGVEPALRWQGVRMHHVPTHACSGHLPGYRTLRMSAAGLAHPAYRIQRGFSFLV